MLTAHRPQEQLLHAQNAAVMRRFLADLVSGGDFADIPMRDDLRFEGPLATSNTSEKIPLPSDQRRRLDALQRSHRCLHLPSSCRWRSDIRAPSRSAHPDARDGHEGLEFPLFDMIEPDE